MQYTMQNYILNKEFQVKHPAYCVSPFVIQVASLDILNILGIIILSLLSVLILVG